MCFQFRESLLKECVGLTAGWSFHVATLSRWEVHAVTRFLNVQDLCLIDLCLEAKFCMSRHFDPATSCRFGPTGSHRIVTYPGWPLTTFKQPPASYAIFMPGTRKYMAIAAQLSATCSILWLNVSVPWSNSAIIISLYTCIHSCMSVSVGSRQSSGFVCVCVSGEYLWACRSDKKSCIGGPHAPRVTLVANPSKGKIVCVFSYAPHHWNLKESGNMTITLALDARILAALTLRKQPSMPMDRSLDDSRSRYGRWGGKASPVPVGNWISVARSSTPKLKGTLILPSPNLKPQL
jgi:hypothetical protein